MTTDNHAKIVGKRHILILIVFFLAIVFLAGCTFSGAGTNVTNNTSQKNSVFNKNFSNTSAHLPPETMRTPTAHNKSAESNSEYSLTPEERSQALAIALNKSELKYYNDNNITYQIISVYSGGFVEAYSGNETYIECEVVEIKTQTAYTHICIDLEKQEVIDTWSFYIREPVGPTG